MAVTYETAEEAYATRQRLWEARQEREEAAAVPEIDRFMFGESRVESPRPPPLSPPSLRGRRPLTT